MRSSREFLFGPVVVQSARGPSTAVLLRFQRSKILAQDDSAILRVSDN
jgi:hypothetical protein